MAHVGTPRMPFYLHHNQHTHRTFCPQSTSDKIQTLPMSHLLLSVSLPLISCVIGIFGHWYLLSGTPRMPLTYITTNVHIKSCVLNQRPARYTHYEPIWNADNAFLITTQPKQSSNLLSAIRVRQNTNTPDGQFWNAENALLLTPQPKYPSNLLSSINVR